MNTSTLAQFVNDTQAAEIMGLKPQTLRNWRGQSKGPAYVKVGRSVRYDRNDLLIYMGKRRIAPEG